MSAPPNADGVWLFRVTAPDVDGEHWGTCSAPTELDALARIRRRMREHLEAEGYGEFKSGTISVQVWPHDFFTIASGYL